MLFTSALQLPDPWEVTDVGFRDAGDGRRELHITVGFAPGSRFPCPEGGCAHAQCPVHDVRERTWRHPDFFQYKAFIHAGVPRVGLVSWDTGLGFAKGIREHLPNAAKAGDKFHVARHANEAVDTVRKAEAKENASLRRTKYLWLSNESALTNRQLETKRSLTRQRLRTARACQMRETLQDIYEDSATRAEAEDGLGRLCSWMMHSRLEPMKAFARLLRRHWDDILAYFDHRRTNALLEGPDSVIQHLKTRARGFRNMDYFSTMIYLTCSRLDLEAVTA